LRTFFPKLTAIAYPFSIYSVKPGGKCEIAPAKGGKSTNRFLYFVEGENGKQFVSGFCKKAPPGWLLLAQPSKKVASLAKKGSKKRKSTWLCTRRRHNKKK
jgi:hypothetical protein